MEGLKDCKYVYKEVDSVTGAQYLRQLECEYKREIRGFMLAVEDLSRSDNIIMALIELIFLTAFWLCTVFSPRDFTRNYLITVATPMTAKLIMRIYMIVYRTITYSRIVPGYGIVMTLNGLNNGFSTYIFVFATPIFLYMVMRTANKRNHFTPTQHWLPFLICGVTVPVILSLVWFLPFPDKYYYSISAVVFYMGEAATIVILILLLLMCFMCCCCSSDMGSSINMDSFHTTMVMIPVFLFLPTYRSSLFCCCQNNREKNLPNKVAPPSPAATVAVINPRNVVPPPQMAPPSFMAPPPQAPPISMAPPTIPPAFSQPVYHTQNTTLMIPNTHHQTLYPNLNVPTAMNMNQPAMNPTLNIGGHVLQLPQHFTIQTPNATIAYEVDHKLGGLIYVQKRRLVGSVPKGPSSSPYIFTHIDSYVILILIYFIIIVFIYCTGSSVIAEEPISPKKIVNKFLDLFDKLSEKRAHYLDKLRLLKATSGSFIEFAGPVGGLIAASLNIVDKKSSPEYVALKELHADMTVRLNLLQNEISDGFARLKLDMETNEYKSVVTDSLDVLIRNMMFFMDPSRHKNDDSVKLFLAKCNGETRGVEIMATYINRVVTQSCQLELTGSLDAKVENVFMRLEVELDASASDLKIGDDKKKSILTDLKVIPQNESLRLIEKMENRISKMQSYEEALHAFHSMSKAVRSQNSGCLTDAVFKANNYKRAQIRFYAEMVQKDLSRLMAVTGLCANLTYPNSPAAMQNYIRGVTEPVEKIASFLIDYIPRKLNMSTFNVESELAKTIIENYTKDQKETSKVLKNKKKATIQPLHYHELANEIRNTLKKVGRSAIKKQILITSSPQKDGSSKAYYVCPKFWCTLIENVRGVDVMIARFDKEKIKRGLKLTERRNYIEREIIQILRHDYYVDLEVLVKEFKDQKNLTLTTDMIISGAITRQKVSRVTKCQFLSYYLPHNVNKQIPSATNFTYNNYLDAARVDDNTCYEFFMFF